MDAKLQKLGTFAASLVMAVAAGLSVAADQPQPRRPDDLLLAFQTFEKASRPDATAASDLHLNGPVQGGQQPVRGEELSPAGKPVLPEPGNWSIALVGLLGVGAIARRRMSA